MMQRLTAFLMFVLSAYGVFYTQTAVAELKVLDRMVASVNNEAITQSELDKQTQLLLVRLRQTDTAIPPISVLHQQLLEKMILEKCQLQLANEHKITVDEETLKNAVSDVARRDNLSVDELQQFLEEQGISFKQFRESIKTELLLSKIQQKEVGARITISAKDVDRFLHSRAGQDQSGMEYRLSHILIAMPEETTSTQTAKQLENEANALVKTLKKGADFSKTAMAKSAGQQALEGGDLGWRDTSSMPTLFAKIAPTLRVGDVYGPIRDNGGFHIIKLTDKRLPSTALVAKETRRHQAMDALYQRKFDELLTPWLRHLRSDAEVKIYLNET